MQDLTLATIAKGAAPERFQDELARVVANILDVNTDPEAIRAITMTVKIKPSESREMATVALEVKSKLAPPKAVPDTMYFGRSKKDGELVATRWDPAQLELGEDAEERDVLPINHSKREAK
jgi:hypothetical protein